MHIRVCDICNDAIPEEKTRAYVAMEVAGRSGIQESVEVCSSECGRAWLEWLDAETDENASRPVPLVFADWLAVKHREWAAEKKAAKSAGDLDAMVEMVETAVRSGKGRK